MSAVAVRDAIVQTVETAVPDLRTCEAHGGRFDETELKRVAAKSPGVFVAALRFSELDRQGHLEGMVHFGLFVVARDEPGQGRDVGGLLLAQSLALLIEGNTFGSDDALKQPEAIDCNNLFRASIDRKGTAMWAITWRQHCVIAENETLANLADFLTFAAEHRQSDDDNVPTTDSLTTLEQD